MSREKLRPHCDVTESHTDRNDQHCLNTTWSQSRLTDGQRDKQVSWKDKKQKALSSPVDEQTGVRWREWDRQRDRQVVSSFAVCVGWVQSSDRSSEPPSVTYPPASERSWTKKHNNKSDTQTSQRCYIYSLQNKCWVNHTETHQRHFTSSNQDEIDFWGEIRPKHSSWKRRALV